MSNIISEISNYVDADMELEPTIRPVIDLSNVVKGTDEMNKLISPTKSINLASRTNINSQDSMLEKLNQSSVNNDVVKAISELRGDMSQLANSVTKLKIVMDTGALVGTLAGPLDSALGKMAIYDGRGI